MLDSTYESYYNNDVISLSMNFKQGKLDGESFKYSLSRGCVEYKETFKDGVLISSQSIKRNDNSTYELGALINVTENDVRGSAIKKLDLEPDGDYGTIHWLRKEGVNFKLLAD
jgi:antitoxin component YwqK of YwqJK toxin-antitoxin module